MSEAEIDARLGALLTGPVRGPDTAFVARVDALIRAEEVLHHARKAAWRRFAGEAFGVLAIAVSVLLLAQFSAQAANGTAASLGAGSVLLLWLALRDEGSDAVRRA